MQVRYQAALRPEAGKYNAKCALPASPRMQRTKAAAGAGAGAAASQAATNLQNSPIVAAQPETIA